MRVLIIEDNSFNAFCLSRLLEAVCPQVNISVITNSIDALHATETFNPNLVILDGDLGGGANQYNGPVLADIIMRKYPDKAVVAWTDNAPFRSAFEGVFKAHHRSFNETVMWSKQLSHNDLHQALSKLAADYNMSYFWQTSGSLHMERLYA
jgi:CheY-like chemotaxis protein